MTQTAFPCTPTIPPTTDSGQPPTSAPPAVAGDVGLLHGHKRPQPKIASAVAYRGGRTFTVKLRTGHPPPPNCRRGNVTTFSHRSRGRMMQRVHSFDQKTLRLLPLFITLTYHNLWPDEHSGLWAHLAAFNKRLFRRYPHAWVVWRKELQARGAPHFHLLVYGVPYLSHKTVAKWWAEIVDPTDEDLRRVGTQTVRCKGYRQLSRYLSKYLAKADETADPVESYGRWWGIANRSHAITSPVQVEMDWPAFAQLRRLAQRLCGFKRWHGEDAMKVKGWWWLMEPPGMAELLRYFATEPRGGGWSHMDRVAEYTKKRAGTR